MEWSHLPPLKTKGLTHSHKPWHDGNSAQEADLSRAPGRSPRQVQFKLGRATIRRSREKAPQLHLSGTRDTCNTIIDIPGVRSGESLALRNQDREMETAARTRPMRQVGLNHPAETDTSVGTGRCRSSAKAGSGRGRRLFPAPHGETRPPDAEHHGSC